MTALKERIQEDVKTAMRSKESELLAVIRLITAAIKQREVDERIELNDDQVLVILDKMLKQRRESIAQYEKASRDDLIAQEQYEIKIIQSYLPEPLSDDEIDKLVQEAMNTTGAESIRDMGKVMGILKPQLQGRADLSLVSQKIKSKLS